MNNDYFAAGTQGATFRYSVKRPDLKDTPSIRRNLANLFKPAYMPEQTRIDFDQWLALDKQGYCYAPAPGPSGDAGSVMAMDFTTRDGYITEVIVGTVSSCQGKKIGKGLGNDAVEPPKSKQKSGNGC